jgi:putative spermidine/putrescine transport system permease protein
MTLLGREMRPAGVPPSLRSRPAAHRRWRPRADHAPHLFVIVALVYVVLVYVVPIGYLAKYAGAPSHYLAVLREGYFWRVLRTTFVFAAEVTAGAAICAYPVSLLARMSGPKARAAILFCATTPLWTSLLARTYAWLGIFNTRGPVNEALLHLGVIHHPLSLGHSTFAALVGSINIMFPLMVLALYGPMRRIDMDLVRAARTLGARPAQAFLRVTLPLSLPGLISGCLLVYIVSLGFFVTPALLGSPSDRVMSMLISDTINLFGDFQSAAVLSLLFLVAAAIALALYGRVVGLGQMLGSRDRNRVRPSRGLGSAVSRVLVRCGPAVRPLESRWTWRAVTTFVLALTLAPYVALVAMSLSGSEYLALPPTSISLRWYDAIRQDPQWYHAALTSVVVGVGASSAALVVGTLAAIGMKETGNRLGRVATMVLLAPAVIPTMIYSVGAYFVAARLGLQGTEVGLALAHSALAVPFVFILVATALATIDDRIELVAQSLGAGRAARLRRIVLPLLGPTLVLAAIVAFQTSFDELVVALFMSGISAVTLPNALWQAATFEATPIVASVSVVIVGVVALVATLGLGASRFVFRRQRR